MGRKLLGSGLAVVACVATLASCAPGAHQARPDRLAIERIEAVAKAHADDTSFTIRLNPAPCDCPAAEVLLDGAWHRVFLEPTDPEGAAEAARATLQASESRGRAGATLVVAGRLSRGARLAGTRAPCMEIKVVALCESGACPPPK
jgi:hypothetical protein